MSSGLHKVWVKNAAGCEGSVDVTVGSAPGAPTVTKTSVQPTCAVPTGSITVTAPLGAEYTYSIDGTTLQASPIFNGLAVKVYTITVRSSVAGSCDATATEEIKAASGAPTVTDRKSDVKGKRPTGSITVTAQLEAEYTYSIDGTTLQASATFTGIAV